MPGTAPDRLPRRVGARIAELRREAELTQREFAKRLGTTERMVQRYESGVLDLRLTTLGRIARHLKVGVEELLSAPTEPARRRPGRPRKKKAL